MLCQDRIFCNQGAVLYALLLFCVKSQLQFPTFYSITVKFVFCIQLYRNIFPHFYNVFQILRSFQRFSPPFARNFLSFPLILSNIFRFLRSFWEISCFFTVIRPVSHFPYLTATLRPGNRPPISPPHCAPKNRHCPMSPPRNAPQKPTRP